MAFKNIQLYLVSKHFVKKINEISLARNKRIDYLLNINQRRDQMAYITSETIKAKREKIKAEFPSSKGWKFSIRGEDHTSIHVTVLASPFNLVSQSSVCISYGLRDKFDDRPNVKNALSRLYEIIDEGNFDKSDSQSDYFHVGFYKSIHIGEWQKPCIWNKQSIKAEV